MPYGWSGGEWGEEEDVEVERRKRMKMEKMKLPREE